MQLTLSEAAVEFLHQRDMAAMVHFIPPLG